MSKFDYMDNKIDFSEYRNRHSRIKLKKKNGNNQFFKNFMFIFVFVIVAIFLLNFVFARFENKTVKGDSKKSDKVVHDDEYYLNMVDSYVNKLDNKNVVDVIKSYENLGIVKCDGYINFRSEPNEKNTRSIIGLMNDGAACDILEFYSTTNKTYAKVKSGGMTGYVSNSYLVTGDEAIKIAKESIALRAIVLVDKLRMRSEPVIDTNTEIGTTSKGERYIIIDRTEEWVKIEREDEDKVSYAYLNANPSYVSIQLCLNEARTQNLKNDVVNYYNNIGVSTAKDYVNVRKTAKANGQIIGKLPGKAGCEILGESGGYYKIKSGLVTGYVSKQYLSTGKKAETLAIEYADLRAIIKIAALKVRTGPGTNYKQWTRVTKEETYIVTEQLDGWVEIEIDGGDSKNGTNKGYISTSKNYVEVRYALEQAIQYTPVSTTGKTSTSLRNKIKEFAVKYIGGKYVWGGNSLSTGVDCSGFVQQVYKNFGVKLPRVSKDQATQGVAVKSANKKVGDLVFYSNSNNVIDHVGIYIGNNQIVHAASSRTGIRISSWNYRDPVTIRNVLGNK